MGYEYSIQKIGDYLWEVVDINDVVVAEFHDAEAARADMRRRNAECG